MARMKGKRCGRRIRTAILGILCAVCIILSGIGGFFSIKGYTMYRKAIREMPVEEIADKVRGQCIYVKYEELPPIYIDAVIAAEDKRFETHGGIDLLAIARALWTDITTLSFAEGGSTITQQIAKNELFTQDKKIERKVAEVFAAWKLERTYTKRQLFEIYVNSIYFGSGYYGIYEAAQGYFEKEPKDLTDYEAVLLTGLPNAPSVYSPDSDPELANKRAVVVLRRMIKCGRITEEEAQRILREAGKPALS